jgi:histidinol phosphatase-like PHP family hydrolase
VQIGLEMEYLPGFEIWTEKMVGAGWEDATWYQELVFETLAHAGAAAMKIEINLAGFDHPVMAPYPSPWIIAECVDRKLPLVVGSDTHRLQNIGRNIGKLHRALANGRLNRLNIDPKSSVVKGKAV